MEILQAENNIFIQILFIKVKIEVGKELRYFALEFIQRATVLLGGPTCSLGAIYKSANLAHLKDFILFWSCYVLQNLRDELGTYTPFYGLQHTEGIGDGRFTHIYYVTFLNHSTGFNGSAFQANLPLLACCGSYGTRLEDAGSP